VGVGAAVGVGVGAAVGVAVAAATKATGVGVGVAALLVHPTITTARPAASEPSLQPQEKRHAAARVVAIVRLDHRPTQIDHRAVPSRRRLSGVDGSPLG
jgi:hypothetical protein